MERHWPGRSRGTPGACTLSGKQRQTNRASGRDRSWFMLIASDPLVGRSFAIRRFMSFFKRFCVVSLLFTFHAQLRPCALAKSTGFKNHGKKARRPRRQSDQGVNWATSGREVHWPSNHRKTHRPSSGAKPNLPGTVGSPIGSQTRHS